MTDQDKGKRPWKRWLLIAVALLVVAALWSVVAPPRQLSWLDLESILGPEETAPLPAPAAPEDATPAAVATHPSFDVVRVTRGGTGLIAGRAAPFAEVEIVAGGSVLGRVTTDRRGEWVLIFDQPLSPGGVEISLTSRLPGKEAVASTEIAVVVVPEKTQAFVDPSDEGVVVVLTPRDGKGRSLVLQRPASSADLADGLMLDAIDYDQTGAAVLSGRAAARAEVRLYLDDAYLGTGMTSDSGRWIYTPAAPLAAGEHIARLDQVTGEGKVQQRIELAFNLDLSKDEARPAGSVVVRSGVNQWLISRKLSSDGFHYIVVFGVHKDQVKDPDVVYPGQVTNQP